MHTDQQTAYVLEVEVKVNTSSHLHWLCFPVSAQHSNQSPVSLTSDASSPRPYVSPRNGTPQSNQKSLLGLHSGNTTFSQTRVSSAWKISPDGRPFCFYSTRLHLLYYLLHLHIVLIPLCFLLCLFRAICLQVNRHQSPCLKWQKNVKRTPELSSREGRHHLKAPKHMFCLL